MWVHVFAAIILSNWQIPAVNRIEVVGSILKIVTHADRFSYTYINICIKHREFFSRYFIFTKKNPVTVRKFISVRNNKLSKIYNKIYQLLNFSKITKNCFKHA